MSKLEKIDKTIMANFYKLVHTQQSIRIRAGASTIKILKAINKNKTQSEFNENLNYCVQRLVCGLASTRGRAMQGYGTLLLTILNTYQISTERLLAIALENFGQINKKTKSENLVAHFLLITIILKSENHKKGSAAVQHLEKIQKTLLDLYNCKSYFNVPVSKLSVEYNDQVPDVFAKVHQEVLNNIMNNKQYFNVNKILCNAHPDILDKYLNNLMATFHNSPDRLACLKQIDLIAHRPQLNEKIEIINKTCKFLLLNSIFKSKRESPQDEVVEVEGNIAKVNKISGKVMAAFKSTYHSVMDHLVSICKSKQRVEQLRDIIKFADKLINNDQLKLVSSDNEKQIVDLWRQFNGLLKKHDKILKEEEEFNLDAITSLFLFYGFQILEYGLECESQLDELLKCCKRQESWADVLTDQLIAILSATECSPWIRKLCESIFGSLLPHISETSIQLLCDAIESPNSGDSESTDGEDEDEDDDDDDEAMSIEETDSELESEEQETEIVDNSEDIQKAIPADVEIELGDDNSDAEEEYLTDEQMMKLDPVIAQMFKLNRMDKKNKKDPAFQLRCLGLLKKVVEKASNNANHMDTVIKTLIPLAIKSKMMRDTKPISDKIVKILSKMSGKSKFPEVVEFLEKHK